MLKRSREEEPMEKKPDGNERFKTRMSEMPNEMVDLVASYARKDPNPQIAINPDTSAYIGIRDPRYNKLPAHQKYLATKIWKSGSYEQVKALLDRWYSAEVNQDWKRFYQDYPKSIKGNPVINPLAVKKVLLIEEQHPVHWWGGGGIRTKMRTKRRISKKHNTKKRTSKK